MYTGNDFYCDIAIPKKVDLKIVYEDDFVLIAHKDAGIIVHDEKSKLGTLANQVATYYAQTNQNLPIVHPQMDFRTLCFCRKLVKLKELEVFMRCFPQLLHQMRKKHAHQNRPQWNLLLK